MKRRVVLAVVALLCTSAMVFGQAGLTGKWQTDNVPAALEAEKNAPAPEAGADGGGGRGGRGGRGGGGGQAIIMDIKADASGNITGTVTEIGNPPVLNIESGKIDGKTITWTTQPRGVQWNLEMMDDNTLTLTSRVIGGRGGGGGRGGAGGGGAPGAGGPPPGGGAAAGGDGAPRGGGGGGGRGGFGGRGPGQPIVLHRVK